MSDTAPQSVLDLVERFSQNIESYRSGSYNETQVRREFIDPLFVALGWDVDNQAGYAEAYKDVVHEASVRVKGGSEDGRLKAPDYSFRVGGTRRFFVEAKKPSVDIKGAPAPAFQVRRYGWSDPDVPLSVLTDFEEFAVYDCRIKPEKGDRPSKARVNYYRYEDYAEKWSEIASAFSKEAVLKGSFDKYASSSKRGTAEPGDEFLKQIEGWRESLAQDLARRNPDLTERQLNAAVQRTIDRIIFLRIAEERGIEGLGELKMAAKGKGVYPRFVTLFREADAKYNSGLFHFGEEKGRAGTVDLLTLGLEVGDKVLKEVVGGLYYPESPYALDVLPTDILGQVYERFLGKVIRLDSKHRAIVEEKPEVKKSGGVFYTPTYIVDRIVEGTVGPLLDGLTPNRAEKIRVVDPACGSGSFLLGVFDYLLGWYLSRYVEAPEKWSKGKAARIFENQLGSWQLTIGEKKRVLLTHLFGVDIDPQAVEVTKLSLLLRVLEGETAQTTGQQALFKERVLPELSSNVKCGNSLVGSDFYDGKALDLFDENSHYRINAFDWAGEGGFPEIMDRGGFDVVIGNPPYVRIQSMREWANPETDYIGVKYDAAGSGNYDLYIPFIEKGLDLLQDGGRMCYIVQHRFFSKKYGEPLRRLISEGQHLSHVTHFGTQKVFKGATTYTALVYLSKSQSKEFVFEEVDNLDEWRASRQTAASGLLPATEVVPQEWNFIVTEGAELFRRLRDENPSLGEAARVFVGVQTSADDVFILSKEGESNGLLRLRSESLEKTVEIEPDLFMPVLSGEDVNDYTPLADRQYVLFPYTISGKKANLISLGQIEEDFPQTAAYLQENKERLEGREKGKMKGDEWHGYIYKKNMARQSEPKVCVPRLVDPLVASYDAEGAFCLDNVDVNGVVWNPGYEKHSDLYLLALLNSSLCCWYVGFVAERYQSGYLSVNKQYLSQLALRVIDFENPDEVRVHDRIVALAGEILSLKRAAADHHGHTKEIAERRVRGAEGEIDRLVWDLYGLSADDRRVARSKSSRAS